MKKSTKTAVLILFVLSAISIYFAENVLAATAPETGEQALFTNSTSPDALILLDQSGSMNWNPAGGTERYGDSSCKGPFYNSSFTGYDTDCTRLAIAKRSIFKILDDTGSGTIDSQDEGSLGIRVGYMQIYDCSSNDANNDPTSGCVQIPGSSSTSRRFIGSKYSQIYCNNSVSCTIASTGANSIGGASASGGTPLVSALEKAKVYLDAHKAADTAGACRKKFVILLTDGADTLSCGGNGLECDGGRYKNRREAVARARDLADAGYRVFVIGFGSDMPDYLKNTLNWMAYYGRTDNPSQINGGNVSDFTPGTTGSCVTDTSAVAATCFDNTGSHSIANFQAGSNDPGYATLYGYAFLAADADKLYTALQTAINIIREANFSFSQASIQSARTADENFVYEGSFEPFDGDPFWRGHLKKYQINADGTVGSMLVDAGTVLRDTAASDRMIKTYKGGVLKDFTTANIKDSDLGVDPLSSTTCGTSCTGIVGYFRGEGAYNVDNWKLGDVFRSTPITVGSPSVFFEDSRDLNNQFAAFRRDHQRTSASDNNKRLIVAGANDGQFHAFTTSDLKEVWSFIPPNLLTKLKNVAHDKHNATEPVTSLSHNYFVDGPVSVSDVWLGNDDGIHKSPDWKTLLVFAEGRGAVSYGWSSSSSCDAGISGNYSTIYNNYCGYHALDITDTLNPGYMWHINFSNAAAQAPYLGDPWSKMMTGRVRMKVSGQDKEKWVGFIGGGYNAADCSGGGSCDTSGKGFFVVDLVNGQVLWSYTMADNINMKYSLPASPAIVDTDNDGFIDTAYIGDLGGNMWRFKFCLGTDTSCSASGATANHWSGGKFFDSSSGNIRPIYTMAGVTKDTAGNLWVYWGTGDKVDPTAANAQEHFYGVKDNNRTSTYTTSNIDNITTTSGTYDPASGNVGYRIQLAGSGEKILAEPTIFGNVVYFTTYTPPSSSDPCAQGGTAKLYAVNYTTGGGILSGGARNMAIGSGIPTAPIVSLPPGSGVPDLYVTTSGGGGSSSSTQRINMTPPGSVNRTNMIFWKDMRIQ